MAKTPQQQAQELAQQILGPQTAALTETYRNKGQGANAAYTASAEAAEGVAPAVEQTYGAAAAREAVIAKGLAVGAQLAGQETAGASNTLLAQQGSPQHVQTADIGSVLGTLGGLSASGLNREGAAFSAAARFLPQLSRNLGVDATKAAGNEGATAVAALNAKRPELVQGILGQIQDQRVKDRAQRLNEAIALENLGVRKGQLDVSKANAATSRLNANTTAAGLKLRQQTERFDQILSQAKLNLDGDKFDLAIQREQRLAKPRKKGGFTAKQKQDLATTALGTAEDDFKGFVDDDGNDVPPRAPVETLRDLIAAGIPFSIAIKAIQRFARGQKPSDVSPQQWALWRATLGWTKK